MTTKPVFYHSPQTRSSCVLWLLEEIGQPYDIDVVNMKAGDNSKPAFLAVNPLGKMPTLKHDGALITETGAICTYLADLYPGAGLAPALGNRLRGPYLRWMFLYAGAFEPAVIDVAMKREVGPVAMSPYGTFDAVLDTVTGALAKGPHILGEKFTAADVYWGAGLGWTMMFGLVPKRAEFAAYIDRLHQRPAWQRAQDKDQQFLVKLGG